MGQKVSALIFITITIVFKMFKVHDSVELNVFLVHDMSKSSIQTYLLNFTWLEVYYMTKKKTESSSLLYAAASRLAAKNKKKKEKQEINYKVAESDKKIKK